MAAGYITESYVEPHGHHYTVGSSGPSARSDAREQCLNDQ